MTKSITIFASGSGSNAENIIRYFQKKDSAKVNLVISNRIDAYVCQRIKPFGVPCEVFPKEEWQTAERILATLEEYKTDLIVLAGFLLHIPKPILHVYPNKIINIHPSLLPKYGGKGMYGNRVHEAVVNAGEKETGITIHYINEHFDQGEHILQVTCPVLPNDTPNDVAKKVHQLEYTHYPEVIEKIINRM